MRDTVGLCAQRNYGKKEFECDGSLLAKIRVRWIIVYLCFDFRRETLYSSEQKEQQLYEIFL